MHLFGTQSKPPHFVEDLVCRFGPREGCPFSVVCGDIRHDGLAQGRHAGMRPTAQGFLRRHAEELFDEVQPRPVGRREVPEAPAWICGPILLDSCCGGPSRAWLANRSAPCGSSRDYRLVHLIDRDADRSRGQRGRVMGSL